MGNNTYASSFQIPIDPNAGSNNWVFFAATYDPTLGAKQLSYYIGKPDQLAYLDTAVTYPGGSGPAINSTGAALRGQSQPGRGRL